MEQDPFQNRSAKFSEARMSGTPGSMMDPSGWGQRAPEPCHGWAPQGTPGRAEDAQFDESKVAGDFGRARNSNTSMPKGRRLVS